MTVGIIGYGRFGKLAAKCIAERAHVLVYDRNVRPAGFPSKRIRRATLDEVASQPIVLLAVPVSSLKETLHSITPFLVHSALVVDVCAVKVQPIAWMKKILPNHVSILGSHPLFGPDSAADSLQGHRIVLCPARIPEKLFRRVVRELTGTGLAVKRMEPDEHDAMIAESLFLTQVVGRVVSETRVKSHVFSTKSSLELMKIAKIADNDTGELFRDMVKYNPHAKRLVQRLLKAEKKVLNDLRLNDLQ